MIRRRVAIQLVLLLLAVSLIPLAGAAAILLKQTEDRIERDTQRDHERLAKIADTVIGDYVAAGNGKLKAISHLIARESHEDRKALASKLNELLMPADVIVGLNFVVDDEQYAQAVQSEEAQRVQIRQNRQRGTYQSRLDPSTEEQMAFGNWRVDNPRFFELTDNLYNDYNINGASNTLTMGYGLNRTTQLYAHLTFDPLSLTLHGLTQGSDREIVLFDRTGTVMAASSGTLHPDWFTSAHAAPSKWKLEIREPAEAAYAPLREARRQILVWLGIAAVLAIALSFLFAGWILKPVRSLTRTAEALERGDLSARAGIERADEIGRLAATFDRMAAAVQSLDRVKSEFIATVSHELRTPLTSIKCSIENIADGVAGPESLGRVRGDLDRLIRLVNELLDLARLDAGESLKKEALDLGQVAESAIAGLEPLARNKSITLKRDYAPAPATADRARIHQVFTNLIDNAIKFSPEGGTVTIAVKPREFAVSDTGEGVPPEKGSSIFERFEGGGGLGLSIAKKIIDLHGGTIGVEASTFTVTL